METKLTIRLKKKVIDLLAKREPFYRSAAQLFSLADKYDYYTKLEIFSKIEDTSADCRTISSKNLISKKNQLR